jgi:hypothetical protein
LRHLNIKALLTRPLEKDEIDVVFVTMSPVGAEARRGLSQRLQGVVTWHWSSRYAGD